MQIANIMANYSLGEADLLRRAMSKKKEDVMLGEKEKFITRSIANGYSKEVAEKVYQMILKFAEYGFAKAHAVAYTVIAYRMAYIKAHEPLYFFKTMLNNIIGSIKDTKEFITEAKTLNISIFNPTINESGLYYEIKNNSLLFPLTCIKNVGTSVANNIVIARKDSKFLDIFDFIKRVDTKVVNHKAMENLIFTGCFDEFGLTRKTLYENLDAIMNYAELVSDLSEEFVDTPELMLKEEYTDKELIYYEYQALGFYLNIHPVNEYRKKYNKPIHLNNISNYRRNIDVIARIEELKEIRTKKQELICFMKISDEMTIVDSPIFADVYRNTEELSVGDIVLINGKTNRRNNKDQFICNQIKVIDKTLDNKEND
jgi:DNA polymerase-3 subunit alpha